MKDISITLTLEDLVEGTLDEGRAATIHQLASQTKVFFGPEREQRGARVQNPDFEMIPSIQDGTILVKGKTRSNKTTYESSILIAGVKYVKEGTANAVDFTGPDGSVYWVQRPNKTKNDVKVRCTCLDFHYRFAIWNHKNGTLLGEPPDPYVKKTDRAPVNPDKVAGVCIHLYKIADRLRVENLLK